MSKGKLVQSVDRALAIVDILAKEKVPMKLSSISTSLGLNISTVHRLLNTLMAWGFVEQDPNLGRYCLGIKTFEVGNAALYSMDIRSIAKPFLKELVDTCKETANLAILVDSEVVYIDQVESQNIIKMFAEPGTRGPSYCTGSGKALLASLKEPELNRVLREIDYKRYTDKTITNPEELRKELSLIKERGYSLDFGELEDDVRCVAVPIKNHEGKAVAAISVSGPRSRMTETFLENELIPTVVNTTRQISERLGYHKPL